MDTQRKKELKEQYRQAQPRMGVLCFTCKATGEHFLLASRNIQTDITSVTFKLNSGYHPNRHLLELWNRYGEEGFETFVAEELEYREGEDDYLEELRELRDLCIERDENALLLWK